MSDCIEWAGHKNPRGYGRRRVNGRLVMAHRVAYEEANGPIPAGLVVMHSCDNPGCVNPRHLSVGTPADNNTDRDSKGRQARLRGERNGMAVLTLDRAIEVAKDPRIYPLIAAEYGISIPTVSAIKVGRLWPDIPDPMRVRSRPGRRARAA